MAVRISHSGEADGQRESREPLLQLSHPFDNLMVVSGQDMGQAKALSSF